MHPRRAIADLYDEPGITWLRQVVGVHVHAGGEDATVALAARAEAFAFPVGGRVLEVASALGGPARYLARRFGATVLCVDATARMQAWARALHEADGLTERCPLLFARTESLPLAAGCCDAAWSQDALCHMNKPAVIREVARVVRPGGVFAFTDWIARTELPAAERDALVALWSFPELLRLAEYVALLESCGFELLVAEDRTPVLLNRALQPPADPAPGEQQFASRYGQEEVVRQRAPGEYWRSLLRRGLTGYGLFIATRRPDARS